MMIHLDVTNLIFAAIVQIMGAISDFFFDIVHGPISFIYNKVSETGLCLRPQVKIYSIGPNR